MQHILLYRQHKGGAATQAIHASVGSGQKTNRIRTMVASENTGTNSIETYKD
jgi:hypothetical protein